MMSSKVTLPKRDWPQAVILLRQENATLRAKNETLQAKVRARDDFIAIVGHEMRNQMNAIMLQVELTLRVGNDLGSPAPLVVRLEALRRATVSFMRRAATMLNITRLTAGALHLDVEELELSGLVREVLKDLEPIAEKAHCAIEFVCEEAVSGIWDRTALEQIAMNLVTNAIKYGGGNAIDVRVSRERSRARLEVQDRGIGISGADIDRIFEPFERAVTRRQGGGFGLGLWISQHLVVAHRGSLDVKSHPGLGSLFTVTLPCLDREKA
jgi:signal transduction histidine kinase